MLLILIFAAVAVCFVALLIASIRRNRALDAGLLAVQCQNCSEWISAEKTECPYCRRPTRRQGVPTIISASPPPVSSEQAEVAIASIAAFFKEQTPKD
jgi:uncharacterized OB-fold protein